MEENKNGFRKLQYKRALVARNIYHMVVAPTLLNLKMMIRQNIFHNFPVTVEYIYILEKLFCNNVFTLKGRKTRQRPKVVVDNFIELLRELIENNQELILCMDIMFINQQELFKTIDKDIQF